MVAMREPGGNSDHLIHTGSLNISRGEIFADFAILGVISENFSLEIFRPP